MKIRLFLTLGLAMLLGLMPVQVRTEAKTAPDDRPRFALLVGINEYKNKQIPAVPGAENDVALMKEVLVGNYGFPDDPKNVRTLTTKQATRQRILDEFRNFLIGNAKDNAGKKPIVVFFFSGHGTRYPNQPNDREDSDSADGTDEAIVPYDSRDPGVFDILDDEIDDLSAELAQHSSDILFVFDSCHSGTATRGNPSREATPDTREREPYTRKFRPSDTDADRREKIVTLSAALPHESAYPRDDQSNGLLTWHLAAALRRSTRTTTYQELMREVRVAVLAEGSQRQHPVVDGDELRPVLGEASNRADRSFPILSDVQDSKLRFGAGRIHGVREGALVAIYDAESTRLTGEKGFLTYGIVDAVNDREATARLPEEKDNERVKRVTRASRLLLAAPAFGGKPVALLLDDPSISEADARTRKNIRTEISDLLKDPIRSPIFSSLVEVSDRAALLRKAKTERPETVLQLKRGKFGEVFPNTSRVRLPTKCPSANNLFPPPETEVYYLQAGATGATQTPVPLFGRFFFADDPALAADEILKGILVYARQRNLASLENKASALNDRVEVSLAPFLSPDSRRPLLLRPTCPVAGKKVNYDGWYCSRPTLPDIRNNQFPQDMVLKLDVRNVTADRQETRNIFVAVFLATGDGKITLLNREKIDNPLTKENPLSQTLITNQPAGADQIKVIVTMNREDLEGLKSLESGEWQTRSIRTPLEQLIGQAGTRTRGNVSLAPSDPDSWGVLTVDYSVLETKFTCGCGTRVTLDPDSGKGAVSSPCGK